MWICVSRRIWTKAPYRIETQNTEKQEPLNRIKTQTNENQNTTDHQHHKTKVNAGRQNKISVNKEYHARKEDYITIPQLARLEKF